MDDCLIRGALLGAGVLIGLVFIVVMVKLELDCYIEDRVRKINRRDND